VQLLVCNDRLNRLFQNSDTPIVTVGSSLSFSFGLNIFLGNSSQRNARFSRYWLRRVFFWVTTPCCVVEIYRSLVGRAFIRNVGTFTSLHVLYYNIAWSSVTHHRSIKAFCLRQFIHAHSKLCTYSSPVTNAKSGIDDSLMARPAS
jgi:hypothetical protein